MNKNFKKGYVALAIGLGIVSSVNADYQGQGQNSSWGNQNYDSSRGMNSQYQNNPSNRQYPSNGQGYDANSNRYQNSQGYDSNANRMNQQYQNQNPQSYNSGNRMISQSDYPNTQYSNQDQYSNTQGYDNGNRMNQMNQRNDASSPSDQDLLKKIKDKIGSGWFSRGYDQVRVQVNNGNVTLSGSVKDWSDKQKVEKEVRDMDGVRSLDSTIAVQEPSSKDNQNKFPQDKGSSSEDEQLNKKIRDNVSSGWLWNSYKNIVLNTNNGVVTLEGTVDSPRDQQKLIDEIQKIQGVRAVRSNLNINNNR